MKKQLTLAITIFLSVITFAQNGINYKAIVKDGSGNIVANDLIQVQFSILQGDAQTNVYTETHSQSTDSNGLIALNIGEGNPVVGEFETVGWGSDDHFLNVQINTGAGLVDMGTTPFMAVPYAIQAETALIATNVTGLEVIDEGNGAGWRLKASEPENYGNIGFKAVDLSHSSVNSTTLGAIGENSVAMGNHTIAPSNFETVVGSYNELYTPDGSNLDRLLVVGNGTAENDRKNALTILKNGQHTINSENIGLIINSDANESITGLPNQGLLINTPNMVGLKVLGQNDGIIRSDAVGIYSAGRNGISIDNSTTSGVSISGGKWGVTMTNQSQDGIRVFGPNDKGIEVSGAGDTGGFFEGTESGVHAESSDNTNPDLILGGTADTTAGDDGIIASDPDYNGSDIFLRSYDAVVVQLDYNNDEDGDFEIRAGNGSNVFEIDESGIAIIGNGSSASKLIVDGTADAVLTNNGSGVFQIGSSSTGNLLMDKNEIMARNNGNPATLYINDDGGNVLVGGSIVQTSDRRLKNDIEDLPYGLNEVLQLEPKSYNWKNREQDRKSLGLIAQEVQPIIKEIVTERDNEEKTLGISYTELIPVLINAIKEQQKSIEALQEQNKIVRAEINAMKLN